MDTDTDTFASMLSNLVRSADKAAQAKAVGRARPLLVLLHMYELTKQGT